VLKTNIADFDTLLRNTPLGSVFVWGGWRYRVVTGALGRRAEAVRS
jgi:hypothetical protein